MTWFQQDRAAPQYAKGVPDYLNAVIHARLIGRRGVIEWPGRSLNLTPLDYFLWGYLKERVYRTKPTNIKELKQSIRDEIATIDAEMIHRAVLNFYDRLAY